LAFAATGGVAFAATGACRAGAAARVAEPDVSLARSFGGVAARPLPFDGGWEPVTAAYPRLHSA